MPTRSYITDADDNDYEFISIKGEVRRSGQTLEDITRKGVDGHGFRLEGQRGEKFQLDATVDLVDYPTANTLWESLIALRGTLVTLVDDFGTSFTQMMLHDVSRPMQRPALAAVGGINSQGGNANQARSVTTFRLTLQDTTIND